jgi:PKD repeat protein
VVVAATPSFLKNHVITIYSEEVSSVRKMCKGKGVFLLILLGILFPVLLVSCGGGGGGGGNSGTQPPVAGFSASPVSGPAPLAVAFTDDSTGSITSWSWDFGDGSSASTEQHPLHTYNAAGTYTVSLTATGPGGSDNNTKTDYITVTHLAEFSASPTSGSAPLTVTFTDQSTGGVTSWSWDFGDGSPASTVQNPSHTYTVAGTYTVSLTATGPGGTNTNTKTDYITVTHLADFSASPVSGSAPLAVTFTDQSTGGVTSWSWDFGDGSPASTVQNPSHTYNAEGTYTVSLTATGPGGSNTKTRINYISVSAAPPLPPVAGFSASPTSGPAPLAVTFTDDSTGSITSWSWDFGDGSPASTEQNPSHTYTAAGTYTVSLTVTGPGGSDTDTETDYIAAKLAFADDFNTDPSPRWPVLWGSFVWVDNTQWGTDCTATTNGGYSIYNTPGDSTTQYAKVKMSRPTIYSAVTGGPIFRSTGTASDGFYVVEVWNDNLYITRGNDTGWLSSILVSAFPMVSGDNIAVTIEGTGTSTTFRAWKNPTKNTPASVSGWDSLSDTADATYTLTGDPGPFYDTGKYIGVGHDYYHAYFDDWYAGDVP